MKKGSCFSEISKFSLSASYTVEAAFIVPLIIFLIFSLISFALFMHDSLVCDAWSAHLAEEERMAVLYGKIPLEKKIYSEGFADEKGFASVKLLLKDNVNKQSRLIFSGESPRAELEISEKNVAARIRYFSQTFSFDKAKGKQISETLYSERKLYAPVKTARLTTGAYRFAGKILFSTQNK